MFTNDKFEFDDQLLTRYLLGDLSSEEAEPIDERSIADEEFSWRLTVVENDLVDAYVRGELTGKVLERFTTFYLASPKRLQKVSFAQAMLQLRKGASSPMTARVTAAAAGPSRGGAAHEKVSFWRSLSVPQLRLQWGFAFAAVAMTLIAGYLFMEVGQLKHQISGADSERAAIDQHQQDLEKQLQQQRAASVQAQSELERLRNQATHLDTIKSIAILLMPQTRGTGQPVSVSLPGGVDSLPVRLQLEADEFHEYQVSLKEPGSDRAVWHSAKLKAEAAGKIKSLFVSIPAKILKQQTYILEATGISPKGTSEFISSYVFRVVLD